ncbi:hypothetical protein M885DRAFT_530139 [Pelagophyceae sp. CCMP2097]|nr:hypothetical protein M885DRAFT_530139 [Pelagophyceae sp. CCMP2097]
MARRALGAVVVLLCAGADAAKRAGDRALRLKRGGCEDACEASHPDLVDGSNCVHECVSGPCYAAVYAQEPLEDGEVDSKRSRAFTNCVHRDLRIDRERGRPKGGRRDSGGGGERKGKERRARHTDPL